MTDAPDAPEAAGVDATEPEETLPPLRLRDPLPPVVDTPDALAEVVRAVAAGTGPVALDAERASGYRYSARAYLVQLRREGAGTFLIDPIPFGDLSALDDAIGDAEWLLHAASQDLVCLAELGLRPRALFDTELAGRLLNLPKVGLASLVHDLLGHTLAKEHSAADWSTRPLPEPWLEYAALDVEVLVELRDILDERLRAAGKREWAAEEFEALLSFDGPRRREEPWRRTSGIHKARGRRALALVRSLWTRRDEIAERRDTTPGRILPDAAILEIASTQPADRSALRSLGALRNRGPRRFLDDWWEAVEEGMAVPESDLPRTSQRLDGPPPPRLWADRNPEAAARLTGAREVVASLAEEHDLPLENVLLPDALRRLAWEPPAEPDAAAIGAFLTGLGARPWQVGLVAERLAAAFADARADGDASADD
ncbi:ribonuclease D [Solicola sp. PLA-1-18]|uniref:ribonuclease D n=1 Tax=Solicola sp. PLA-1-18 TaxID=3380532 RepID=UPI003B7937FA